jgi:hypothetical protein
MKKAIRKVILENQESNKEYEIRKVIKNFWKVH